MSNQGLEITSQLPAPEYFHPDPHELAINNPPMPRDYTPELADEISSRYAEGMSLCAISRLPEMPPYTSILRWAKQNPEFMAHLEGARRFRALACEAVALQAADEAVEGAHPKDIVAAQRLKFDAYKWAAEVADPSVYGKKTQVSGDKNAPLTFIIHTGFPDLQPHQRPPELGPDGLIKKAAEVVEAVIVGEPAPLEEVAPLGAPESPLTDPQTGGEP